jgi:hypothetical protein
MNGLEAIALIIIVGLVFLAWWALGQRKGPR